jgi:two-component system CheB/CheR fusion protein
MGEHVSPMARRASHPTHVVGIGGSAGALEPFKGLLASLPPDTGMAFVFVLHLGPEANSQLAQILSRRTAMPVTLVCDGILLQANHVYVIPPNTDLLLEGDVFKVISPRTGRNKQVDGFLVSLAKALRTRAISVIMSGYGGDGAKGCQHLKQLGGVTLAQDGSAEVNEMPRRAQATGCVDFVLSIEQIARELERIGHRR